MGSYKAGWLEELRAKRPAQLTLGIDMSNVRWECDEHPDCTGQGKHSDECPMMEPFRRSHAKCG